MVELTDMVKEFLIESHENLDQLDRDLIVLEQDPQSPAKLDSIFRTIHTIKGTCGFLGFSKLESLTHVGESLLCKLRDGVLVLDPNITSGLLAQVDAIRQSLDSIESTGREADSDYSAICQRLLLLQQRQEAVHESTPESETKAPAPHAFNGTPPLIGELFVQAKLTSPEAVETALEQQRFGDERKLGEILTEHGELSGDNVKDALKFQHETRLSEASIRVDVSLLEKLMNRVGELVLARNQILQFKNSLTDTTFLSTCQRLNLITTELQEGVMKTRMQPIDTIWSKFPRVVRDLALKCGKQVRVEMEGKETELDKTIIEAIKDPLTHLVRNSVDHGIEPTEKRIAAGKPPEGLLRLRAFHEGGQVNIEITDDGAGLNMERIRQKSLDAGLISAEQAGRMSERELSQLIFRPGFSTADKITNVSGRGVGMDVVKTNVEKIGGTVDVQSQLGLGTTIKIKIPLTLAIIPALVVSCGGARYAIPQISLLELVRLEGADARQKIEKMHDAPVYRLRGKLLPLVYLNRELGLESVRPEASAADSDQIVNIVVLQADDRQFGLVVDRINDTEEIVVKPAGRQLKGVAIFAGATIMGDGKVALILDVLRIAQSAHVVGEIRDRNLSQAIGDHKQSADVGQMLLIVGIGSQRLALPISMVARLEEINANSVERSDGQEVVQYRGQMLPLIRVAEALGLPSDAADDKPLQVVVYAEGKHSAGLVVDRIIDTVFASEGIERRSRTEGIVGSLVIQQRITDLIDPPALIRRLNPYAFDEAVLV